MGGCKGKTADPVSHDGKPVILQKETGGLLIFSSPQLLPEKAA